MKHIEGNNNKIGTKFKREYSYCFQRSR